MPPFRPDPTKVSAGLPVYDKGEYDIELGEPRPFLRITSSGKNVGATNYGVMFRCIILEGPQKGKPYIHNCMMHTTESEGFSKQFQMAAYGYEKRQEEEFDVEVGAVKDWIFDPQPDSGEPYCGDGWRDMKGKRIKISLDKVKGKDANGQEVDQQKVTGMRPA